jgi:serine/threonine-protein kinase
LAKKDGRYEILFKLASGGMATVYVGRARGSMGFSQLVAIKEPHPHLLDDPQYRKELVAEARLASLIHHVNVVDVRDVYVASDDVHGKQIRLVMDYIEGASLGELLVAASRAGERLPPRVVMRVVLDACAGLHAAHELVDEKGRAVGLVHRDVSPQNLLVGVDGATRVSDFGVAKATAMATTHSGSLKGKLAYMSPEYVQGRAIDRRVDVFAIATVAWEALAGRRLFRGDNDVDTAQRILSRDAPPLSSEVPDLAAFDGVLETALAKNPDGRFSTTQAFASALESVAQTRGLVAGHAEVAAIVKKLAGPQLESRRAQVRDKLAGEPGFISLMSAEPPSLPASSVSGNVTLPLATTVSDAVAAPPPPPAAAVTAAYGSAEPTTSDTSHSHPAGVPKPRSLAPVIVAVLALFGGAAIFFAATHKTQPAPAVTTTHDVAPPVVSSIAPAETASIAPLASVVPSARPAVAATHARTAPTKTSAPSTTTTATSTDPPPNPY